MEIYSAMRKKEILPLAITWMDLVGIVLSEISQKEKDRYCMFSLIGGIRAKLKKMEQNGGCQGLEGRGNAEMLVKGTNFSYKDE